MSLPECVICKDLLKGKCIKPSKDYKSPIFMVFLLYFSSFIKHAFVINLLSDKYSIHIWSERINGVWILDFMQVFLIGFFSDILVYAFCEFDLGMWFCFPCCLFLRETVHSDKKHLETFHLNSSCRIAFWYPMLSDFYETWRACSICGFEYIHNFFFLVTCWLVSEMQPLKMFFKMVKM